MHWFSLSAMQCFSVVDDVERFLDQVRLAGFKCQLRLLITVQVRVF